MDLFLKNGTIVTQNQTRDIFQGHLLIRGNRIAAMGPDISNPGVPELNVENLVIVPGFIQTHIHMCQTLFRNLADDLELLEWLSERIWPMESAHTPDSLRTSVQLSLVELFKNGTTTVLDMGALHHAGVIFEEMVRSGIRGFSGKVLMDTEPPYYRQNTAENLAQSEHLIQTWHGAANGRIGYALAPRFVLSCSDALWDGVRDLSEKYHVFVHTHASENKRETELVKTQTGLGNIEFFAHKGLASPNLLLAHCIWVSETEMNLLQENDIKVLHCPSANLKLGSGFAPVPQYLQRGINVSLGSDGAPCNNTLSIFQEMRLAALIHKPRYGVKSITAQDVVDMATINGARALGLEDEIGSLEVGKKADLVILNLNKVNTIPADNVYSQLVYSAHTDNVLHVMVDGEWVVQNQQVLAYNENEVVQNAWKELTALLKRLNRPN